MLVMRRFFSAFGKGELGGPFITKVITAILMVMLWVIYILLSSFEAYGHIVVNF